MEKKVCITADGSATLVVPELNESYHSINGAVQESMHIFIGEGLTQVKTRDINILEMGFGTGLNALLTWKEAMSFKSISYHGIELYPLSWEEVEILDYISFLKLDQRGFDVFMNMHTAEWDTEVKIDEKFRLKKTRDSIRNIILNETYHLVFFDAFAPAIQPELWQPDVFEKLYKSMHKEGILVTYSAKGEVRRSMQTAGFYVERLPGPPGKREFLRAIKKNGEL